MAIISFLYVVTFYDYYSYNTVIITIIIIIITIIIVFIVNIIFSSILHSLYFNHQKMQILTINPSFHELL